MTRTDIQVGAIGVPIIIEVRKADNTVETSLGSATALKIYLKSPGGTAVAKTAVFDTDGSDGKIKYVTVAGDLSVEGTWRAQPGYTLGSFAGRGSDVSFQVRGNL